MSLRTTALLSSLAVLLLAPLAASAQSTSTPRFDRRQAIQQQRIEQGEQSGTLTPREAARLEKGQDHLQHVEDQAKADGIVTKQERVHMARAENKQRARIERQKHDAQHDFNHDGKLDRPLKRR